MAETDEVDLDRLLEDLLLVEARLRRQEVDQFRTALASSRQIGIAIGILMASDRSTSDAAFDRLVRASRNSNRKLRDLADEVVRTGALPST